MLCGQQKYIFYSGGFMKKDVQEIIEKVDIFFKNLSKYTLLFCIRVIEAAVGCFIALMILSLVIK